MVSPPDPHGLVPLSSSHRIVPLTASHSGSRGNHPRRGRGAFVSHTPPLQRSRGLGGWASRCVCPVASANPRPGSAGRCLRCGDAFRRRDGVSAPSLITPPAARLAGLPAARSLSRSPRHLASQHQAFPSLSGYICRRNIDSAGFLREGGEAGVHMNPNDH